MRNKIKQIINKKVTPRQIRYTCLILLGVAYLCCLPQELFHAPYSTVVTDKNGELLGARIASDGQWRFPPRKKTPPKLEQCLLAFEDQYFYYHWGVNPLATSRAFVQNLKNKRIVSGGSTLTMQTIRLSRCQPRTFCEKIIEMIWATRLEFRASKAEILSMYISHAPFGGNVVGLDAAAWRYFGHSPETLSWAESALLAVLPNAPSAIHLSKGREKLLKKRNRLLRRLEEKGIIQPSTYELAISEPLPDKPHSLPQIAPHLVSHYYQTRNGLFTQSTIDKGTQMHIEALAERWSNEFRRSDIQHLAILVIDLPSNQVVAYCGNVRFNENQPGNQVDIIQSPRSTGSILKPFLYEALLQEGSLLPSMLVPDVPININGYMPQNYSHQYEGAVPASEALARSLNIPAVTQLQAYGIPKFIQRLKELGFTTIKRPASHYGLSLILGGAEATLWEVTHAYAQLGRLLLTKEESPWKGAAWLTLEALTEVNRPEEIDWESIPSMQTIAWKTGTSYGFRDAWAVGITPRYAVGVWAGNASGEGKPGLVGALTAAPVLFDVFNSLPPSPWFERPTGILVDAEVCRQSGHLKGRFCTETDTLLILPAGLQTTPCPYHHLITLSKDGQHRVYARATAPETTIQRPWFVLPPVWEWYYKQHHPEYIPLPPFLKGSGEDNFPIMQFIYPPMQTRIRLTKQLDGSKGYITAELAHTHPQTTVFWHLDEKYYAETRQIHQISLQPTAGKHTLTAVDEDGNSISTVFYIE
ncbi:penicillin-binding protein 1C [gut metagenome]|uniref:peptidoglycan glycosyltransferase n=1 Tax=gut metagenome TaxID=749906 RepID=J9G5M6_9ZZZZ